MSFKAIDLPDGKGDLVPYLSQDQVDTHYEKHHKGYATKLNVLVTQEAYKHLANKKIEEIIKTEKGAPYNLSAQIYNHDFYWVSVKKNAEKIQKGKLLDQIEKSFGTFEKFKEEFITKAGNHFGSGWCWLVQDLKEGKLKVIDTHDATCPLSLSPDFVPLLVVDIWEHAYYIDVKNDRVKYINNWWNIINWEHVEKCLK
eukprot:EC823187.1.p1 GENE.EC823187.1~~EC823187.1.p1  ORF type:complete len:212 (+),score=96.74 EC823187.1:41-637(+)